MQVAAPPPITTQPSNVKPESPDWEDLLPSERLQRQMSEYNRTAAEQHERTKKGEAKREEAQQKEREELFGRWRKDQIKQENEKKESMKEITSGNMASQNGGFNNAISTKSEGGRKRKAEEEAFKGAAYPKPPMMNPEQQHWQVHQMHAMNFHPQQQMMQQYNNHQRVPPNGAAPMVQNGMPMYNGNFYPPCSTAASTSASELASFPEVPQMNNSPVVLPSVNGSGATSGTPPQFPGQANVSEQHPTPPALVNTQEATSTDLCSFDPVEQIEQFLPSNMPTSLTDLGNNLDNELGTIDFNQPSSSAGQQQAVHSVGTPSNVVSPADGFQLQVNGPQSNHSQQNPMSNSHCNPPITPTNQQPQQQMQQFPPIGHPLLTSTPKNPMNPTGAGGNSTIQHHQSMMNPLNSMQSPAAMQAAMASPHMMPAALQSPHMGMGSHHSPGLPPSAMANPAMQPASVRIPHNPMGMPPGMAPMPGMGMPWPSQQWNGMPAMPGPMPGYPNQFAPDMRMEMPYGAMSIQQQQQMQVQMVRNFIQHNPLPPEFLRNLEQEIHHRKEALRKQGHNAQVVESEGLKVHHYRVMQMGSGMMMAAKRRYEQHQQMMAAGHHHQPSPTFVPYPSAFPTYPHPHPHPLHPYPSMQ